MARSGEKRSAILIIGFLVICACVAALAVWSAYRTPPAFLRGTFSGGPPRPSYEFTEHERDLLDEARERIPELREGTANLRLLNENGEPLGPDWELDYELKRHEFYFTFVDPADPVRDRLRGMLNSNMISIHGGWVELAPDWEYNYYDWRLPEQYYAREWRQDVGYALYYHTVVWNIYMKRDGDRLETRIPIHLFKDKTEEEREAAVREHVRIMAEYTRDAGYTMVNVWNEPVNVWANAFEWENDVLLQKIKSICAQFREINPESKIILNLGEPLFAEELIPGREFMAWVRDNDPEIDVIGLQFWHNGFYPWGDEVEAATLEQLAEGLNDYNEFGIPLLITEFSAPSKGSPYPGWNWNETRQADFAEAMFILTAATPNVIGTTYFSTVNSFLQDSGLMDRNGEPREVFYRLRDLVDSWTTTGSTAVRDDGSAKVRGWGGTYYAAATNSEGEQLHYEFTVKAREEKELSLNPGSPHPTVPEPYRHFGPLVKPENILECTFEEVSEQDFGNHGMKGHRPHINGMWGWYDVERPDEETVIAPNPMGVCMLHLPENTAGQLTFDLEFKMDKGDLNHFQVITGTRRFTVLDREELNVTRRRVSFRVEANEQPVLYFSWPADKEANHVVIKNPVFTPEE